LFPLGRIGGAGALSAYRRGGRGRRRAHADGNSSERSGQTLDEEWFLTTPATMLKQLELAEGTGCMIGGALCETEV
jgi:hypothetical protein